MKVWYGGILPGIKKSKDTGVIQDAVITDRPLAVTSFGMNNLTKESHVICNRPNGRKDYLISFVSEGSLYEAYQNQIIPKNSIVLYKPNQPQFNGLTDEAFAKSYWIHFSGNNVEEILSKYKIKEGITTLKAPFSMFIEVIDRMYIEKNNPYWQDICDCLLMELLIHIGATNKTTQPRGDYQRLLQYMKENCTRNLPIKAYADFIGFSEVYFVRFFKKASKLTPHAYLIKFRLERACSLLVHTDMPINKIATSVGYNTARYFSKAFFNQFGITPSEYRTNNNKNKILYDK